MGKYWEMVCEVFGGSALVMYLDEEAELRIVTA